VQRPKIRESAPRLDGTRPRRGITKVQWPGRQQGMRGMATTVVRGEGGSGLPVELSTPSRWSRWVSVALKVGLSALAVGMVVKTVDFSAAWERALNQDRRFLVLAAVVVLLQIFLGGMRWHVILTRLGGKSSVLESLRIFYISAFFNTWMWGAVGGD